MNSDWLIHRIGLCMQNYSNYSTNKKLRHIKLCDWSKKIDIREPLGTP